MMLRGTALYSFPPRYTSLPLIHLDYSLAACFLSTVVEYVGKKRPRKGALSANKPRFTTIGATTTVFPHLRPKSLIL